MPEPSKRRKVGERFRNKRKSNGNTQELLGKRKGLMRRIQGLDPEAQADEIRDLQKQADDLMNQAMDAELSLKDAYGLALTK